MMVSFNKVGKHGQGGGDRKAKSTISDLITLGFSVNIHVNTSNRFLDTGI